MSAAMACTDGSATGDLRDNPRLRLTPVTFADLDGWTSDRHGDAFAAFSRSCDRILTGAKVSRSAVTSAAGLVEACTAARDLGDKPDAQTVRAFFETRFTPYRVEAAPALLTAYYEPALDGALEPDDRFRYPLYRRPAEISDDADKPGAKDPAKDLTRTAIDNGSLAGRGLELVYLADPVDVYFVHIQGSARIVLPDGHILRIGFDGKNGHPYRSVGKAMLADGVLDPDRATAEDMKDWLRAHPDDARTYMQLNPSYVFFRLIAELDADSGPIGGEGVALTAGRSLAIDRSLYPYGLPFWIEVALPTGKAGAFEPFNRLMVAQDTGAAITGPARGDIFWGTGQDAGVVAGRIAHPARFVVLLPCGAAE